MFEDKLNKVLGVVQRIPVLVISKWFRCEVSVQHGIEGGRRVK